MAYEILPRWEHGNTVAASELQKYSDSLDSIYDITGDYKLVSMVGYGEENGPYGAVRENSDLIFLHKYQWLYFQSDGEIVDLSETEDPTSLSESDDALTFFDLDSVPWLSYGQVYRVVGCTWACEYEAN